MASKKISELIDGINPQNSDDFVVARSGDNKKLSWSSLLASVLTYVGTTTGWNAGTGTWSYSSADDPTFVISINNDQTAIINVGDRIKLTQTTEKYFIVTAVGAYSGGATLVTVYGGTDYDLASAAITSPYISHAKSPFGFPMSPAKWSVTLSDTTRRSQASPTENQWYKAGTLTINVPIGVWRVSMKCTFYGSKNSTTSIGAYSTLSTSTATPPTETHPAFTTISFFVSASGNLSSGAVGYTEETITATTKTAYYVMIKSGVATASEIGMYNDLIPLSVSAVCAYL